MFEPFFTTKATGTGLGLAQVQTFMKQIGGEVAAESVPGSGTYIILSFPIASGGADDTLPLVDPAFEHRIRSPVPRRPC